MRRPRTAAAAILALALAAAALVVPIGAGAAEPPSFEPGTLVSGFPEPVAWSFTFRSAAAPLRVELLAQFPGSDAVFVSGPGPGELVERPDGSWLVTGSDASPVTPNTLYRLRLRVTTADGVFLGPEASILVADERFEWRVRESERLRLHWYEGTVDFARRALRVGEEGVTLAEELLGVRLPAKVDVFVYADQAPFRDAIGPGSPENAAGVPFARIATFFALIRPEQIGSSWVGDVVPHELAHLVLEAGIGTGVSVPLWLNEGLAVYLATGNTDSHRRIVRAAVRDGTLVPLDGLVGTFPSTADGDRSIAAYAEAVSAVDYMVETYGQPKMARLVEAFGVAGADEAFETAFGVDTAEFGAVWLRSIDAATPEVYGPQPAPAGPLPSDWQGPPPVAGLLPAASPAPTASPSPGPGAIPGAGEGGAEVVLILLLVAVLVAVGGLVVVLAVRGRRSS